MKFLIAGLGSIGRRHIRNLWSLGERDIRLYRTHHSTLPEDEFAGLPVEIDLDTALAWKPDAVIVTNPTALHLDVAIPAARKGCHLLLEKPISNTVNRLDELESIVQRNGIHVLVGFQFRFHPGLQKVKQLLSQEVIGSLISVRAHWGEYLPDWHPWEDYKQGYSARQDLGGGVILTLSHPLDYLLWLLGDVKEVWALLGNTGDLELNGVEACVEIGLRFTNGVVGSVHLDYIQHPPCHHLEIVGTLGTIRWNNADGVVSIYQVSSKEAEKGDKWMAYPPPIGFERNQMFISETRHFLAVAHRQAEPLCTLQDGKRALELAIAVRKSVDIGQIVRLGR